MNENCVEAEPTGRRRTLPPWAVALAAVVLVPILAYAVLFARGRYAARDVERAWARDGRPLADVVARNTPHETNDAARDIEAAAARLGFDLSIPGDSSPMRATAKIPQAFGVYLKAECSTSDPFPSVPPAEVTDWLRVHAVELDGLVQLLLSGEAPRWRIIHAPFDVELPPNLLGHVHAQRVLVAASLEHGHHGRTREADEFLQAAFRLNDSLWERPDLLSQLTACVTARSQFGALRKLDGLPPAWEARLARIEARHRMTEAVQVESHVVLQRVRASDLTGHDVGDVDDVVLRDVLTLASGPAAADRVRRLVALDAAAAPCMLEVAELQARVPRPGRLEGSLIPPLANALTRASLVDLHAEMTRHVLRARRERRPAAEPGACADWTFRTDVLSDGSVLVSVDGKVPTDPTPPNGLLLPLSWGPHPSGVP